MATCNSITVEVKFREKGEMDLTSSRMTGLHLLKEERRMIGFQLNE